MCANSRTFFFFRCCRSEKNGQRLTELQSEKWRSAGRFPPTRFFTSVMQIRSTQPALLILQYECLIIPINTLAWRKKKEKKLADIVLQLHDSNGRRWMEAAVVLFVWWGGRGIRTDSLLMQPAWGRSEGLPQTNSQSCSSRIQGWKPFLRCLWLFCFLIRCLGGTFEQSWARFVNKLWALYQSWMSREFSLAGMVSTASADAGSFFTLDIHCTSVYSALC